MMGQVGDVDPKVTLSIYAQVMFRGEGERERLEGLVNGSDWAPLGTSAQSERWKLPTSCPERAKTSRLAGPSTMGAAGFEPATSRV